jgi:phosphatidylethanolamine/phosphatidyl-N-methylethanolamine N-methyltransferase
MHCKRHARLSAARLHYALHDMTAGDIIYGPLTPLYDVVCGAALQPGRRRAIEHLNPLPGETILEVGVGTGRGLENYPHWCRVVGIDLSRSMMKRAQQWIERQEAARVSFLQMDAGRLAFPDETFDAVYVPYTINVVPDPVAVGRELLRVCRPGGRILMLNHFAGIPDTSNLVNAIVGRAARACSVNWHLNIEEFLDALGLDATVIESVNVPRLSSIVMCRKQR